jgi:hypothetical protein
MQSEQIAESEGKAKEFEQKLADLREQNLKLNDELKNEIKQPIYSNCVVPTNGVRIYNKALASN